MKIIVFSLLCLFATLSVWSYEVAVLGDVHYDEGTRAEGLVVKGWRLDALNQNVDSWKNRMPEFLTRAAQNGKYEFVIQLGDLVEGYFGSAELHQKMVEKAAAELEKYFKVPIYTVRGNHDYLAVKKGGRDPYADALAPRLPQGESVYHRAMMYKGDLYVFTDFNMNITFVEKAFATHPDAKRVFVICHFPVLPCGKQTPDWIVLGRPNHERNQTARAKLRELLLSRNAIVLSGHTHTSNFMRFSDERGRSFTQIGLFSETTLPPAKDVTVEVVDPTKYFESVKHWLKDFPGYPNREAVVAEYIPGIKEFIRYTPAISSGKLEINDDGSVIFYRYAWTEKPSVEKIVLREADNAK